VILKVGVADCSKFGSLIVWIWKVFGKKAIVGLQTNIRIRLVEDDMSDSVLSKTAIFPGTMEGNVHSFNQSASGWSPRLRKANV